MISEIPHNTIKNNSQLKKLDFNDKYDSIWRIDIAVLFYYFTNVFFNFNVKSGLQNAVFVLDVCNFIGMIKNVFCDPNTPLIPEYETCNLIVYHLYKFITALKVENSQFKFVFIVQKISRIIGPLVYYFNFRESDYELYYSTSGVNSPDDKVLFHVAFNIWEKKSGEIFIISNDLFRSEVFDAKNDNNYITFYDYKNKKPKDFKSDCFKYYILNTIIPKISMNFTKNKREFNVVKYFKVIKPENFAVDESADYIPKSCTPSFHYRSLTINILNANYLENIAKDKQNAVPLTDNEHHIKFETYKKDFILTVVEREREKLSNDYSDCCNEFNTWMRSEERYIKNKLIEIKNLSKKRNYRNYLSAKITRLNKYRKYFSEDVVEKRRELDDKSQILIEKLYEWKKLGYLDENYEVIEKSNKRKRVTKHEPTKNTRACVKFSN